MTNKSFNGQDWPSLERLGSLGVKNTKYFKFSTGHAYVDIPNPEIDRIYNDMLTHCKKSKNINDAYMCAKKFLGKEMSNLDAYFKSYGLVRFFVIYVSKTKKSNRPLEYRCRIHWTKFQHFVEKFPYSKIHLEDKYRYLLACKYSGSDFPIRTLLKINCPSNGSKRCIFKDYKSKFNESIFAITQAINKNLDDLINLITKKVSDEKNNRYLDVFLDFVPDMVSALKEIKILSNKGYISSCYRELRSLIERFLYVFLDGYMECNSFLYGKPKVLFPLLNINSLWRNQATNKKSKKRQLKNLNDLFRDNILKLQCEEKYKNQMKNTLLEKMSVEMYVALGGRPSDKPCEKSVPCLNIKDIKRGINDVKNLANNSDPCWKALIDELEKKWRGKKNGEFPFPTTNFVLGFMRNILDNDLNKKINLNKKIRHIWEEYSLFIHPYIFTWQILPKTSIIEYRIFENELKNTIKPSIEALINYIHVLCETKKKQSIA